MVKRIGNLGEALVDLAAKRYGSDGETMLTMMYVDQVMVKRIGNRSRCHVVPCRFSWSDLKSLEDGTVLIRQFFLVLNGVSVITSVDNSSGEDESAFRASNRGLDIRAFCFHCVGSN